MGPLVDAASLQRVQRQLAAGTAAGGVIHIGGSVARPDSGGPYLEPTVVTGTGPDNPLVREELFAPILTVQVFRDESEAVALASDSEYGLAAAVWTADLGRAHRVSRALKAGTVWVNCYEEGDMTVPFGGVMLSGSARDESHHAMLAYTDGKTTWIVYG